LSIIHVCIFPFRYSFVANQIHEFDIYDCTVYTKQCADDADLEVACTEVGYPDQEHDSALAVQFVHPLASQVINQTAPGVVFLEMAEGHEQQHQVQQGHHQVHSAERAVQVHEGHHHRGEQTADRNLLDQFVRFVQFVCGHLRQGGNRICVGFGIVQTHVRLFGDH